LAGKAGWGRGGFIFLGFEGGVEGTDIKRKKSFWNEKVLGSVGGTVAGQGEQGKLIFWVFEGRKGPRGVGKTI